MREGADCGKGKFADTAETNCKKMERVRGTYERLYFGCIYRKGLALGSAFSYWTLIEGKSNYCVAAAHFFNR